MKRDFFFFFFSLQEVLKDKTVSDFFLFKEDGLEVLGREEHSAKGKRTHREKWQTTAEENEAMTASVFGARWTRRVRGAKSRKFAPAIRCADKNLSPNYDSNMKRFARLR